MPSALVIGSVIPDAWYFVPFLARTDSHSLAGLLLFCLPAGLFTYAAFHLIFKQPLLALLPATLAARLGAWTSPSLPAAPWRAVVVSLLAGALTHLAWDGFTHGGFPAHRLLQHASTLFGTAFLLWWIRQKLQAAPNDAPAVPVAPAPARTAILLLLLALSVAVFGGVVLAVSPSLSLGIGTLRSALRAAGVTALSTLGLAMLAYCLLWRRTGR